MKQIKETWSAWKYYLLMLAILLIGPTQCAYDNYVKWKVAQAAIHIKESKINITSNTLNGESNE